jgi:Fic family protein
MTNSLQPSYLANLALSLADGAAMRKLGDFRGRQELYVKQQPQTLAGLRTVALIESADSSNRLEGIVAPLARLKALVNRTAEPRNRSEQEIAGYRDALDLIHQSAEDIPVSTNVIKQLHQQLYSYLPQDGGEWKSIDNEIIEKDDKGNVVRVRFKAVPAVATPQAMEDLVENHNRAIADGTDPLIAIPLMILDFLCIHPFRDGNGRVARLLTLQLLYQAGYDVGRYISLEHLYEKSSQSYYDTLEESSHGWHEGQHDVMPWVTYFWGILNRAYEDFEERVGTVHSGRGSKSQRVREAVERKIKPFSVVEIERDCPDVSRDTIRAVLREMKKEGRVRAEGRGPGARWRLLEVVK